MHSAASDDFSEDISMMLGLDQSIPIALLNISITDDILAERTETFRAILSIAGTNLPNITVNPNMATVSIEDDDCKSTLSNQSVQVLDCTY